MIFAARVTYDNGANVVGVNSGVKMKILAINPRPFFTACGCHNWNLLLGDATKSSRMAIRIFFAYFKEFAHFSPDLRRDGRF
jgi:hypothetical protein